MNQETNNETLSPEEADKRRKEITDFYKKQIPHLKVQAQYETLMTEIEENRAKRLQAQAFIANAYMEMEKPENESGDSEAAKEFNAATNNQKRKLKVEQK
tara:strand:- start:784 stop:1083 length:300 start_codon:yes stop_codon:yes gene_type:complete